jgi:NTE family protein
MTFLQKIISLAVLLLMVACASVPRHRQWPQPNPLVEAPVAKKIPKLGLALGGGAARGFAHIGVLQVLEEEGIKPTLVVGTSAGSVVAAFYASGKTASQLQWLADTMDESQFTDWANPFTGPRHVAW